jgi:hypothetical protein
MEEALAIFVQWANIKPDAIAADVKEHSRCKWQKARHLRVNMFSPYKKRLIYRLSLVPYQVDYHRRFKPGYKRGLVALRITSKMLQLF